MRDNLASSDREEYGGVEHYRYAAVHEYLLARDQAGMSDETSEKGVQLERLRKHSADLKEIEVLKARDELVPVKALAPLFAQYGMAHRRAADDFKRRFGNEALDRFNEMLDELDRITDTLNVTQHLGRQPSAREDGAGSDPPGEGSSSA